MIERKWEKALQGGEEEAEKLIKEGTDKKVWKIGKKEDSKGEKPKEKAREKAMFMDV